MRITITSVCILLFLGIGHAVNGQLNKIEYQEFDLENGLHIIMHKDNSSPIVAINLPYHVGSKNEQSDRTGFRRIGNWLVRGISDKKFGAEIFEVVLGYAVEAAGPESRNPAAVFMAILKRELDYKK